MTMTRWDPGYAHEKLAVARRNLMLPHSNGPLASIEEALRNIDQGLYRQDLSKASDEVRRHLLLLQDLTGGPEHPEVAALANDTDKQIVFSRTVDELTEALSRADLEMDDV